MTIIARNESTQIGSVNFITYLDAINATDVRETLESIIQGNRNSKVLILTGVHNSEVGSADREIEFSQEDVRSILAVGGSPDNIKVVDVGRGDPNSASDAIANSVVRFQPRYIIWASCKSASDHIVLGILQGLKDHGHLNY